MRWVKIRSWHGIRFTTRGGGHKTLCGRYPVKGSPEVQDLPSDEKSCESCLKIITRQMENELED